ncbi:MAG: DUF4476 domain-containing protein [Bacteroidota bacterium]
MKKIFTLGLGILISIASFAGAYGRLTVATEANSNIKVTVDGNHFNQQSANSSVVFENLQPGFHSVSVYQLSDKRTGMFNRKQSAGYRLVYTASVHIKPLFTTTIQLNRYGKAQVNEQPMRGGYDNRRNDGGYDNNDRNNHNDYYGRNNGKDYGHAISNEDFFAAERVMDRENDNGRLLFAKRIMDDNFLSAEQVKELARFFSFDNIRLDFAKYAYYKTTDKDNFSVVCNAFSSKTGRDEVMSFIKYRR